MSAIGPVALITNPAAATTTARLRELAVRTLGPAGLAWAIDTTGPGDAAELARRAAAEGAAMVVTLGGDGIAHEAAGALGGGAVGLVPLPGGNANVLARALGWPNSTERALPLLSRALAAGRGRRIVLGRLVAGETERLFAINAGVGLDADTVEWIEARPRVKRRLRQAGFAIGAARAAARLRRAPPLRLEGAAAAPLDVTTVLAACGRPYTYLGPRPLDLVPDADFDGPLAYTALVRMRMPELARLLGEAALGRPLPRDPAVILAGRVERELVVTAGEPVAVQADGEALGRHLRVRLSRGPLLETLDPRSARDSSSPGP
ncbi:MAG: diacylglycerol kinase family protein [Thermoleophilia bacterium]